MISFSVVEKAGAITNAVGLDEEPSVLFLQKDNQQNYPVISDIFSKKKAYLESKIGTSLTAELKHYSLDENNASDVTTVKQFRLDNQTLVVKVSNLSYSTPLHFLETFHHGWTLKLLPWKLYDELSDNFSKQNAERWLDKIELKNSIVEFKCKKSDTCATRNEKNWHFEFSPNTNLIWPQDFHWQSSNKMNAWWLDLELLLKIDSSRDYIKEIAPNSYQIIAIIDFEPHQYLEFGLKLSLFGFLLGLFFLLMPWTILGKKKTKKV